MSIIISNWTVSSHSAQFEVLDPPDPYAQYQEANLCRTIAPGTFGNVGGPSEHPDLTQLWEHFLRLQLPAATTNLPAHNLTSGTTSLWQSLAQLDGDSMSLRYALAAVASARIGRIESNRTLYKSAGRLYIRAVSSLRESLSDKTQKTSIDVIAAVMTLAAYEVRTTDFLNYRTNKQNSSMKTHPRGSVISVTPKERVDS